MVSLLGLLIVGRSPLALSARVQSRRIFSRRRALLSALMPMGKMTFRLRHTTNTVRYEEPMHGGDDGAILCQRSSMKSAWVIQEMWTHHPPLTFMHALGAAPSDL